MLADCERADPHEGRLAAIEAGRVERGARIVLVGVADATHLLVRLLEHLVGEGEGDVDALVFAPSDRADGFDEWGRLRKEAWREELLPIGTARWHVAEKPVDQAGAVARVLASWDERYTPDEVTLGVADDEVTPYLEGARSVGGVVRRMSRSTGKADPQKRALTVLTALCVNHL